MSFLAFVDNECCENCSFLESYHRIKPKICEDCNHCKHSCIEWLGESINTYKNIQSCGCVGDYYEFNKFLISLCSSDTDPQGNIREVTHGMSLYYDNNVFGKMYIGYICFNEGHLCGGTEVLPVSSISFKGYWLTFGTCGSCMCKMYPKRYSNEVIAKARLPDAIKKYADKPVIIAQYWFLRDIMKKYKDAIESGKILK